MKSYKQTYDRDLIGYAGTPPHANWPDKAKIAVQFVLNYEEGGESCVLHGDTASEIFLSEIIGAVPFENSRNMSIESAYEFGSRAGVWRILDLFKSRQVPLTVFAVAMAAQRHPQIIERALTDGHEIAGHGLRWVNYQGISKKEERADMDQAVEILSAICGKPPVGWYTGRTSEHTRNILAERGGFLYDADDYSDDLPFWSKQVDKAHLVVPYTLDTNDMRFVTNQGFNTSEHYYTYLKDAFDTLYEEGNTRPKMMSIGMHCRIVGRPGRFAGLKRFLDYIQTHDQVWICRREDIARHWISHHPYASNQSP